MKDPVVIAIWAYTLISVLSIFGAVLAIKRSHRKTEMDLEHQRQHIKNNELLWAENIELKEQLPKLEDELRMLRSDYSDVNAERERWKKERDEWKQSAERFHDYHINAIQERDQARALANDLRAYLDRALAIINEQNEQIQRLTPVEHRKHSIRGKDGRFVRKVATPYFVVKQVREVCVDLDKGKVVPAPTPVKHLREVNEELAKAAEVPPTESERPDDSHVGEQAQPADMPPVRDWNVPQRFPSGHIVRNGEVVFMQQHGAVSIGTKGKVVSWYDHMCTVEIDESLRVHVASYKLAPIDPRQHPEHPEYGKGGAA